MDRRRRSRSRGRGSHRTKKGVEQFTQRTKDPKTQRPKDPDPDETRRDKVRSVCVTDTQSHRVTQRHTETRPDQTRPDQTRPDQTRPDQTRPDQTRPDQTRPDETRRDQMRPDETRPDESRRDQRQRQRQRQRLSKQHPDESNTSLKEGLQLKPRSQLRLALQLEDVRKWVFVNAFVGQRSGHSPLLARRRAQTLYKSCQMMRCVHMRCLRRRGRYRTLLTIQKDIEDGAKEFAHTTKLERDRDARRVPTKNCGLKKGLSREV